MTAVDLAFLRCVESELDKTVLFTITQLLGIPDDVPDVAVALRTALSASECVLQNGMHSPELLSGLYTFVPRGASIDFSNLASTNVVTDLFAMYARLSDAILLRYVCMVSICWLTHLILSHSYGECWLASPLSQLNFPLYAPHCSNRFQTALFEPFTQVCSYYDTENKKNRGKNTL